MFQYGLIFLQFNCVLYANKILLESYDRNFGHWSYILQAKKKFKSLSHELKFQFVLYNQTVLELMIEMELYFASQRNFKSLSQD